jgi:hypothetical protein
MVGDSLSWFEIYSPKGCCLPDVTATLRPLEHRPRQGLTRLTPIVVFELWLNAGTARWLVGMDSTLSFAVPHQMSAQLRGLTLAPKRHPERATPTSAAKLIIEGLAWPLRTEMAGSVALALLQVAETLQARQSAVVQWVVGPSAPRRLPPSEFHLAEALGLKPPAQPDLPARRAWGAKSQEPIFGVHGRLGAVARSARAANGIIRQLHQALSLAGSAHAHLRANRPSSATGHQLVAVSGARRRWSGIVNATELAMLISWPVDGVKVPGSIGPSIARAPKALLTPGKASSTTRILGTSLHPADAGQLVTLPVRSGLHHLHIVGPTGSGKSTELAQLALTDAAAGHGVLVVEPKGDLVDDMLARLPSERHKDVVLIEPGGDGPVVGLNPLAGPRQETERRADELLDLFKELFGSAIGPRSGDVLLHALITAGRLLDGTLTDVPSLLTNPVFRRRVLTEVNDPLVLAPFWAWFDNLSEAERGQVTAPIMNKLRVFTTRSAIRQFLGQPQPGFTPDDLLAKHRIVLVNLNRGAVGPQTARLLGSLLLTQLWQAMQRRSKVPVRQRHPVMVVVDEWQDYAGALDFGEVLAQARGLGVGFTLAHQHLGQLSSALRAAVLANARSRLTFRPAPRDTSAMAAALGGGVSPDDLDRLGAYQAAVRILTDGAPSQPFVVQTLPLADAMNDVESLRRNSTVRFGVDGTAVDADLAKRWRGSDPATDGPVGIARRTPR